MQRSVPEVVITRVVCSLWYFYSGGAWLVFCVLAANWFSPCNDLLLLLFRFIPAVLFCCVCFFHKMKSMNKWKLLSYTNHVLFLYLLGGDNEWHWTETKFHHFFLYMSHFLVLPFHCILVTLLCAFGTFASMFLFPQHKPP